MRRLVQKFLRKRGLTLTRYGWTSSRLRKDFDDVKSIIDVGVAYGTPELYAAFPDQYLVLVEPLEIYQNDIQRLLAGRPGVHIPFAAGSEPSEQIIHLDPNWPRRASLNERPSDSVETKATKPITISVRPLDEMIAARDIKPPFGLKIDVEGHELAVIQGAREVLKNTQFVIAETSMAARFVDGYRFHDLVGKMHEMGFTAVDILNVSYHPGIKQTVHCDLYFVRDNSL